MCICCCGVWSDASSFTLRVRRLRRCVRRAVQRQLAQEHVQPGVPQVLQRVPLRAGGHGRQQGDLRQVLHGLDHARQQDQVPVNLYGMRTPCSLAKTPCYCKMLLGAYRSCSLHVFV
jgi:hypothetical protein